MLNLKQIQAQAKKARANINNKPTPPKYKVGDDVHVKYCPFGTKATRWGVVTQVTKKGYMVNFTSTKGESCDGQVRKAYQRQDGTWVTKTSTTELVAFDQVK